MRRLLFIMLCYAFSAHSQDSLFTREVLKTLTSAEYAGRGYVKDGSHKTAEYLAAQFRQVALSPMSGKSYFQKFKTPINTFPAAMQVKINNQELKAGIQFIVSPESKTAKGKYTLIKTDSITYEAIDGKNIIVQLKKKLTWGASTQQADYTAIELLKDSVPFPPGTIELSIQSEWIKKYKLANVCGYIKGTQFPDSFLLFTAHYDHLGHMGETVYFPGANDNASGIATLLNLMRYFKDHPPAYSIAFIAFAAEEAGLIGSEYFVKHPLIPLKNIKFLINLDLLGTGDEGITVVNATEYKKAFEQLKEINYGQHLLSQVKPRGKARNSDHYWFTEAGVPGFFIYTMGGIKAYHDIYDVEKTLPLTKHKEVIKLLTLFAERQMQQNK